MNASTHMAVKLVRFVESHGYRAYLANGKIAVVHEWWDPTALPILLAPTSKAVRDWLGY